MNAEIPVLKVHMIAVFVLQYQALIKQRKVQARGDEISGNMLLFSY